MQYWRQSTYLDAYTFDTYLPRIRLIVINWNMARCACTCIPARYTLAAMSFLGVCNVYIFKAIMSVGVLQMDRNTATLRSNESSPVSKEALSNYIT